MKKRKWIVPAALLAVLVLSLIIGNSMAVRCTAVKTAVRRSDLPKDGNYIICDWKWVTGYNWYVSSSEGMGKKGTWCNIIGPSPYDLDLYYEFTISRNKYVFYVTDVQEYYSEEMSLHMVDYTVSGWDILYPVRRESMLTFLKPPGHIIENDLWKAHRLEQGGF